MVDILELKRLIPLADVTDSPWSDKRILAAGPLTRQPNSQPYRVVLICYINHEYSVHDQVFSDDLQVSSFTEGDYFQSGPKGLTDAVARFGKRVSNHSVYMASLFREDKEKAFSDRRVGDLFEVCLGGEAWVPVQKVSVDEAKRTDNERVIGISFWTRTRELQRRGRDERD